MPLTINVGLSRKSSENYQSKGTSINVTAELDHSLLAKPQQLHHEIQALYRQAQEALDQQTSPPPPESARPQPARTAASTSSARTRTTATRRTTPPANQNGTSPASVPSQISNPSQPSGHVRSITPSQKRALHAIADKLSIDLEREAQTLYGCSVSQLSIREASTLIDRLKSSQQSQHSAAQAREERRR